jgi:small-conductance mechanosensitive channel
MNGRAVTGQSSWDDRFVVRSRQAGSPTAGGSAWRLARGPAEDRNDVNVIAQLDEAPSVEGLVGSFKHFGDRFIELLPNLLAALVFLALTVAVARLVRRGVEAGLRRTSTEAYVHLLVGKIVYFATMLLGMVVALSIGGVNLGWVVGSLGLVTVAIGFALQEVLGNFVAGIVLLLEHPFTRGDEIRLDDVQGTVEDIRVRATQVRTPDGQLVVVPNMLLFTGVVTNSTATMHRRVEVRLSVPGTEVSAKLRARLLDVVGGVQGVSHDPEPRLLVENLDDDKIELLLGFWVDPRRHPDLQRVRSEVLEATQAVLARSNMELTASRTGSSASDDKKAG